MLALFHSWLLERVRENESESKSERHLGLCASLSMQDAHQVLSSLLPQGLCTRCHSWTTRFPHTHMIHTFTSFLSLLKCHLTKGPLITPSKIASTLQTSILWLCFFSISAIKTLYVPVAFLLIGCLFSIRL